MRVNHYEGEPFYCSEECSRNNEHKGDPPAGFICKECGGGGGCFPKCRERELNRRYEPWEGLTGEQELYTEDDPWH